MKFRAICLSLARRKTLKIDLMPEEIGASYQKDGERYWVSVGTSEPNTIKFIRVYLLIRIWHNNNVVTSPCEFTPLLEQVSLKKPYKMLL